MARTCAAVSTFYHVRALGGKQESASLVRVNCKYAAAAGVKVWVDEGRGHRLQADYNLRVSVNPLESVIELLNGLG